MFEVGRVYLRDAAAADGPLQVAGLRQPMRVGGAAFGPALDEQWGSAARAVDFFDVKADLEAVCAPRRLRFEAAPHPALHPGRSARVLIERTASRRVAGRAASALAAEVRTAAAGGAVRTGRRTASPQAPLPRPTQPSRFPPVVRDIALLVDAGVPRQALLDAAEAEKPAIVQEVAIFDLYQGPNLPAGKKSLAFRVVMQDTERTLTDAEADSARDALVALWGRRFGAILRS